MLISAPETESELLQRCDAIAGKTLGELARHANITMPENLRIEKGWVGQLLELILGATAKSKAEPDFEKIGVELKTLPLNAKHQPKESTFVCTAKPPFSLQFEHSLLWKKLRRVLWLPVEADNSIALAKRRVGSALLWSPDAKTQDILKQDWQELTELLSLGHYGELSAKHGQYLQCRPKAANASVTRQDVSIDGESMVIVPRGFYLRTLLTKQLFR